MRAPGRGGVLSRADGSCSETPPLIRTRVRHSGSYPLMRLEKFPEQYLPTGLRVRSLSALVTCLATVPESECCGLLQRRTVSEHGEPLESGVFGLRLAKLAHLAALRPA